ncbi:hypothetical protein B0H14DRAFT_2740609, partial [Mycena olivaceomarginata]
MPTLNAYKTIEEQKKRKTPRRRRMRTGGSAWRRDCTPGLASRQHEGGSQLVWRRACAGGESEVESRRGTRSSPRTPTGSTPRRSSHTHPLEGRGGGGVGSGAMRRNRVRAGQISQAMGACTVVSWPPPPRLSSRPLPPRACGSEDWGARDVSLMLGVRPELR